MRLPGRGMLGAPVDTPIRSAALSALLVLAARLAAAEPVLSDVGLRVELRPTRYDFTWDDGAGRRSGEDAFSSALAVGPGVRWSLGSAGSPWALILGGALLYDRATQPGASVQDLALRAEIGPAWSPVNHLTLSLCPWLGAGWSRFAASDAVAGEHRLDGILAEAGAALGARWAIDRRWSADLAAGWLVGRRRLSGDGAHLDLDQSGPWLGLALAWTIDPVSRRLE